MLEPREIDSNTLVHEPNLQNPYIDKEEPNRAPLRIDIVDPM
jgi:hypothetical protein